MNISRFQSSISQKGTLQNNRFRIQFALPQYLREASLAGQFIQEQTTELISLRCESANFPGHTLTLMEQPRIGVGPLEFMPHNATLGDVQLTFLVDAFGDIHRLFYEWHNRIVNVSGSRGQSRLAGVEGSTHAAFEVGFKSDYAVDLDIFVYDKDNETSPVMQAKLYKAYPTSLPPLPLSWGSNDELIRLTIPFQYTDFDVQYNKAGTSWKPSQPVVGSAARTDPVQTAFENAIGTTATSAARTALTNPIVAGAVAGFALGQRLGNSIRDRFTD